MDCNYCTQDGWWWKWYDVKYVGQEKKKTYIYHNGPPENHPPGWARFRLPCDCDAGGEQHVRTRLMQRTAWLEAVQQKARAA